MIVVFNQGATTKSYLQKTNDGSKCHRCFIHHMPSKKVFYKPVNPLPPLNDKDKKAIEAKLMGASSAPPETSNESPLLSFQLKLESQAPPEPRPLSSGYGFASKFIPPSKKYQFLVRDRFGHEKDLNDSLTPRLMPYESWKDVVTNVCKQTHKTDKYRSNPNLRRLRGSREPSALEGRGRKSSSRVSRRNGVRTPSVGVPGKVVGR